MTIDKTADLKPAKDDEEPEELNKADRERMEKEGIDPWTGLKSPTVQKTGDVKEKKD